VEGVKTERNRDLRCNEWSRSCHRESHTLQTSLARRKGTYPKESIIGKSVKCHQIIHINTYRGRRYHNPLPPQKDNSPSTGHCYSP